MQPSPPMATAPGLKPGSGGHRRLIAALAVTQTAGYGVLYYAFSALLGPMSSELQISTATAAGALTVAVLTTGAMSIPVGRWLDARGGHALMTVGAVIGAIALAAWSQVQTAPQLYAVFVLIGVASAMVLYGPAFAVIVAVTDPARRTRSLLAVTLVGGFASFIFIPLTGHLVQAFNWRATLLILLAIYALLAIPLHAVALRRTGPRRATTEPEVRESRARVLRDSGFWLLAAAFVLHGAALAVIAIHLVLYLVSLGHQPAIAATLAGLLGLLSVTGRVLTAVSLRWLPMATIAALILLVQGVAIALLPSFGRHLAGAAVCLVLFGLGFGIASIATPAILVDRYGPKGYGTIAGTLATPVLIARACAPFGGAVLAAAVGYTTVILLVAAGCISAAICLALKPNSGGTERERG